MVSETPALGSLAAAMTSAPRVSVVVPAFNEPAAVLAQSLNSVRAQTFGDFECLVIDESTDAALAQACREACAGDTRFHYVRPSTRLGLAASLNHGFGLARGELVARFDSDDICVPERFALQVAFLDAHPEVDVLGGGLEIMSEDGRTLAFRDYPPDHATIERRFHATTPVAHPTVMLRKSVVQRHGAYNPAFRFAEDLDLWLRLLNQGIRFANLPHVLVRYRQDNTSRKPTHWQYNRQARVRNFSARQLPLRLAGLLAVTFWSWLPPWVQQRVFKPLLFRHAG